MEQKAMRLIDANALDFSFDRRCFSDFDEGFVRGADEAIAVVNNAPTIEAEPVWIVHRKNGIYDVYKGSRNNWVIARLAADNIFSWLAEQNLVDIRFVDEEMPPEMRAKVDL